jgi:hypothetical protein
LPENQTEWTEAELAYQNQAIGLPDYNQKVDDLERTLLGHPEYLIEAPVEHLFTDGLYTRLMFAPAGSIVTTKTHKTEHPYVVLKGHVSVVTPDGTQMEIRAPFIGVTKPGTRRVAIVHEDTVWVTFHVNEDNTQDLAVIEDRVIERRELEQGRTAYELAQEILERSKQCLGE